MSCFCALCLWRVRFHLTKSCYASAYACVVSENQADLKKRFLKRSVYLRIGLPRINNLIAYIPVYTLLVVGDIYSLSSQFCIVFVKFNKRCFIQCLFLCITRLEFETTFSNQLHLCYLHFSY